MKSDMPIELIEKIKTYKKWLFHGDQIKIAKEVDLTATEVSKVLNLKRFNRDVVALARQKAIANAAAMGVEIN
jgi:hypothetical protein